MKNNKFETIKNKIMDVYEKHIGDLCVATLIILAWSIIAAISPIVGIIGGLLVLVLFGKLTEKEIVEEIIIDEES